MIPDLSPFFAQYEALVREVDAVFAKVDTACPGCVKCHPGCADCCHALFDLSLIEALYLNRHFQQEFGYGARRSAVLSVAAESDRQLTRLKRGYFRSVKEKAASVSTEEAAGALLHGVMEQAARDRVRCPLLGEDAQCQLYAYRPITCRIYGIPTAIDGKVHVCGLSGFAGGDRYPTVHLDKIQDRLDALSLDLQKAVSSRFSDLHTVYVPVSMALLTNYDEAYLGIGPAPDPAKEF